MILEYLQLCAHQGVEKAPYVLGEGKEAASRLDLQNTLFKKYHVGAFKKTASLVRLEGAKVVDFGCGTSSAYEDIRSFIGDAGTYIGVDCSAAQIEINKQRYPHNTYIHGDENSAPVKKALASADIVYMRVVVMHQKHQIQFLKTIYKHLKPGAVLIIQEPENTLEQKKMNTAKYPFSGALVEIKARVGARMGLNYNFASQLEPVLKTFQPTILIHDTDYTRIPTYAAKELLTQTVNEVHRKNSTAITAEELARYLTLIDMLPTGPEHEWVCDLLHTCIVKK